MEAVYTDEEIKRAFNLKKAMLATYWITFSAVAAILIGLFVINFVKVELWLDRSSQNAFMWISILLSSAFAICSVFFFGVKYRYTKAYCKMYSDMLNGRRDEGRGQVLELVPELSEKYAVKFHGVKVLCPPVRRGEQNVRLLLIEKDHDIPQLQPGVKFAFISHSNVILGYEIIETA